MRRGLVLLALAALALLALRLRLSAPGDVRSGVPPVAPGSLEAEQDAWRLRLIELALSTGSAPREDRFLAAGDALPVPWPPLFHAGSATLARHLAFRGQPAEELGSVDEGQLRLFLSRMLAGSGALAVLAAFVCARALHGGRAADLAGLAAAALQACLPSIVFAERAGRFDPHAWSATLAFAHLGAVALAQRAREVVDATLGGLIAGTMAGLALACDAGCAPAVLAGTGSLAILGTSRGSGARRALFLLVVAAAVVSTMAAGAAGWRWVWPAHQGWGSPGLPARLRFWPAIAIVPAAFVALALLGRRRERLVPLLLALAAVGWALLLDPGAAGVHAAGVLGAAIACADVVQRMPRRLQLLAPVGLVLLASPTFWFVRSDAFAPPPEELAARAQLRAALFWMRTGTPSSGPWNHPQARQDWSLLIAPGFGATAATLARRPVTAAVVPGTPPASVPLEAARAAAALLAEEDASGFVETLRVRGVRYVLVAPGMAGDAWLVAAQGEKRGPIMFERLLEPSPPGGIQGLERVWPANGAGAGTFGAGPVIWRVEARESAPEELRLRSR